MLKYVFKNKNETGVYFFVIDLTFKVSVVPIYPAYKCTQQQEECCPLLAALFYKAKKKMGIL